MREKFFDRRNRAFSRCLRLLFLLKLCQTAMAEDGYRRWQRYEPIGDTVLLEDYPADDPEIVEPTNLPTCSATKSA